MDYIAIDIETTIRNQGDESVGDFKASPYNINNEIVMVGATHEDTPEVKVWSIHPEHPDVRDLPVPDENTIVVGHNIAFDLGYLLRDFGTWREWSRFGMIWDTMLVAYILSGQVDKFASLDAEALKAGGTVKDDAIKDYWKANIDTSDIPSDELEAYQIEDVKNTELVFLKQMQQAEEQGQIPLIRAMMDARLATLEMERNGMYVDTEVLWDQKGFLESDINAYSKLIMDIMSLDFPKGSLPTLNINSTSVLSCWLFGGKHRWREQHPMLHEDGSEVLYKSGAKKGEVKMAWKDYEKPIMGKFTGASYSAIGANGNYATGEAVLKKILGDYKDTDVRPHLRCLRAILLVRGLRKDMSAYYVGYNKLIWPDSCLHPSFQHCSTDTGRLSCNKPNLQQASGKN